MLDLILSESNVGSEDQVKLRKYVKKVTKAAEKGKLLYYSLYLISIHCRKKLRGVYVYLQQVFCVDFEFSSKISH